MDTHTIEDLGPAQDAAGGTRVVIRLLGAMTLLAIGVLGGLLISNRLLTAQLAVYRDVNMPSASVIIDLMDDFVGPLVGAFLATFVTGALTLTVSLLSGRRRSPRRTATAAVLVILLVSAAAWFGLGRSQSAEPVPPMTPTPVAIAPTGPGTAPAAPA